MALAMDASVPDTTLGHDPAIKVNGARRLERHNVVFRSLTLICAVLVLATFLGMFVALFKGAFPAYHAFGFDFFTTEIWNPVKERFGILAPIGGTLITSVLAMTLAVP